MKLTAIVLGAALGYPWVAMSATIRASQGFSIDSQKAVELLGECSRFTDQDVGRQALRMSAQQISQLHARSGRTPVLIAWFAFETIHASPLKFRRPSSAEDTSYNEVKQACASLERDFYDDKRWQR